ncbi:MAG TPA: hypothetical protein PLP11_10650 [Bacteroidales bacterium]|nr:hypothetical protein [Bacteroidales bacterium]
MNKRIRNLRLIASDDPLYEEYNKSFKNDKDSNTPKEHTKSEMVAYVLELTVREWVKSSGWSYYKRIIAFETYDRKFKKYITRFDEIDYVLKNGKQVIIGEVKASYQIKGILSKAAKQLNRKKNLLNELGLDVKMQLIFFDLSFLQNTDSIHQFSMKYNKAKFQLINYKDLEIEYLRLNPFDIYQWGVTKGIIKTPELLPAAIAEAEIRHLNKIEKIELKNKLKMTRNYENPTNHPRLSA